MEIDEVVSKGLKVWFNWLCTRVIYYLKHTLVISQDILRQQNPLVQATDVKQTFEPKAQNCLLSGAN